MFCTLVTFEVLHSMSRCVDCLRIDGRVEMKQPAMRTHPLQHKGCPDSAVASTGKSVAALLATMEVANTTNALFVVLQNDWADA